MQEIGNINYQLSIINLTKMVRSKECASLNKAINRLLRTFLHICSGSVLLPGCEVGASRSLVMASEQDVYLLDTLSRTMSSTHLR